MELKHLLQIAITSVTFNVTDSYIEDPDTVCLREEMEVTQVEEGAGRSSVQLTLETQTDKEVNMYTVLTYEYMHISRFGIWLNS